jgi:uncharacterized protein YcnI
MDADTISRQHSATCEITQGTAEAGAPKKYSIRVVAREDLAEEAVAVAIGMLQTAQQSLGIDEGWHLEVANAAETIGAWSVQLEAIGEGRDHGDEFSFAGTEDGR